ncbi:TetR/AcrR family transcriptional regulator [Rhizobium puerariae]|uniref:TetR/AcrR family transcriptional regulator n=1 Tax=Rhizobium puerariae TaxID=1585791 RepID=A0ABV6ABL7_9HYPH
MSEAHRREKQPEQVRRSLLDHAARCAVDEGLASLTLQAVADAASVTKGGLLHHFPSKQALIEAVFEDMLRKLDEEIERLMAEDAGDRGRFTRAYVEAFFQVTRDGAKSPWAALSISCMTNARLRALWSDWMRRRLERHAGTDSHPIFKLARYAADGIWLANLTEAEGIPAHELAGLRDRLKRMTQEEGQE